MKTTLFFSLLIIHVLLADDFGQIIENSSIHGVMNKYVLMEGLHENIKYQKIPVQGRFYKSQMGVEGNLSFQLIGPIKGKVSYVFLKTDSDQERMLIEENVTLDSKGAVAMRVKEEFFKNTIYARTLKRKFLVKPDQMNDESLFAFIFQKKRIGYAKHSGHGHSAWVFIRNEDNDKLFDYYVLHFKNGQILDSYSHSNFTIEKQ